MFVTGGSLIGAIGCAIAFPIVIGKFIESLKPDPPSKATLLAEEYWGTRGKSEEELRQEKRQEREAKKAALKQWWKQWWHDFWR